MTDSAAQEIRQWTCVLNALAERYSRLGPDERGPFIARLIGQEQYECADPQPTWSRSARNELLVAIAASLATKDIITTSANGRQYGLLGLAAPDLSDLALALS